MHPTAWAVRSPAAVLISVLSISCRDATGTELPPEPPADVNEYVSALPAWQDYAPLRADADTVMEGKVSETSEVVDATTYTCTTAPYSLTQTPDKVVTLDPDVNILWLGALLQGRGYKDGIGSLREWSVRERAPIRISLDLLTNGNSRVIDEPNLGTVSQAIGELVQQAHAAGHRGGSSVSYSSQETESVKQGSLKLGISTRYLGSGITASLSASRNAKQKTLTAYFVQRMFTVSFVLPNTPRDMFSPAFTAARMEQEVDRGHVGSDNPPVYVSSIVYGRILIFTFTSSTTADSIRLALAAARKVRIPGDTTSTRGDSLEIDAALSRILTSADIRVVTIGGEGRNATALIQTGKLADYFNEDAALTSARPISYTVRNLGDNSIARVSETTEYNLKECTAVPTTGSLRIDVTPNDATVSVRGPGGFNNDPPTTGDQHLTELVPGGYSITVSRTGFATQTVETTVNVGEPTVVSVSLQDPLQTATGAIYTITPTRLIVLNGSCAETFPDIFHEVRVAGRVLTQRLRTNSLELQNGQWDHPGAVPAPDRFAPIVDTVFFSNKGGTTTDTVMTFSKSVSDNDGAGADDLMASRSWSYYKNGVPTGDGLFWTTNQNGCSVRLEANIAQTGNMFN